MAKYQARLAQQAEERRLFIRSVERDEWSQEQQQALEVALLEHNWYVDRTERWTAIAKSIPTVLGADGEAVGKTRNQCLRRYKYLKEIANALLSQRQSNSSSSA